MDYIQLLKDKVSNYKSYSTTVKERVLKQFEGVTVISELQYKNSLKKLPTVMKSNKTFISNCDKVKKRVYRLEVHRFAPELNTLHLDKGLVSVKVSQQVTIKDAIEYCILNNLSF